MNTGTISESFRASGNLLSLKALLIHFVSSLKQNSEFFNMSQEFLRLLLYLTESFYNILHSIPRNKLKGEVSIYFEILLYFKYTWMFGKTSYNLFDFIGTINRFTNPLKKILRLAQSTYYLLRLPILLFSETILSISINVIFEPPWKCLFVWTRQYRKHIQKDI